MRGDPALPLIFTRDHALAAGLSRHQIAQRVRTRGWRPLRRAIYIEERRYAALSERDQHLTAVIATLMARADDVVASQDGVVASQGGVVASHLSAAVAYGWVLPLAGTGPVTLTDGNLDSPTRHAYLLVLGPIPSDAIWQQSKTAGRWRFRCRSTGLAVEGLDV